VVASGALQHREEAVSFDEVNIPRGQASFVSREVITARLDVAGGSLTKNGDGRGENNGGLRPGYEAIPRAQSPRP
jgi:hypothetical protein